MLRHLVQIKVCIHVYYFSKIPLKFILLDDVSNESILFCKNRNFDRLPTKKKKGQETHFGSTHSLFSSLFQQLYLVWLLPIYIVTYLPRYMYLFLYLGGLFKIGYDMVHKRIFTSCPFAKRLGRAFGLTRNLARKPKKASPELY